MPEYTKKEAKAWAQKHLTGDIATQTVVFKEDGELDLEAIRDNYRRSLKFGAEGIWVNGAVGEHTSLTMEEKKRILELAVEEGESNKVPVIACVSYGCMKEVMEMVKHAENTGADSVYLCGPTGETLSEEGVFQWYKYVADRVNISLFIFNTAHFHPLGPRNIARLAAECPNIVGLKPCPNILAADIVRALKEAHTELLLFTPFGRQGFPAVLDGSIPVEWATYAGSNRFMIQSPEDKIATKCWNLFKKGDWAEAKKLYLTTIQPRADLVAYGRLFTWITPNSPLHNIPLWKYWLELMGLHGGLCRLPFTPPTPYQKQDLKDTLTAYGIIKG